MNIDADTLADLEKIVARAATHQQDARIARQRYFDIDTPIHRCKSASDKFQMANLDNLAYEQSRLETACLMEINRRLHQVGAVAGDKTTIGRIDFRVTSHGQMAIWLGCTLPDEENIDQRMADYSELSRIGEH